MAKLVLSLNGTVLDQRFIDQASISIGRGANNDIVINDPKLSREHARIVTVGEDQIVEDLASSNGTRVNGNPLQRQILQHRDTIELGSHRLLYLSSRVAADVELDRTLLIKALPRHGTATEGAPLAAMPALRAAKIKLPEGNVKVLASSGAHPVGENVVLDRVVATFGTPGEQLVVITRRPQGYFLTHVEGPNHLCVNQQRIGTAPCALRDGDLIEAAGYRLEFQLATPTEPK